MNIKRPLSMTGFFVTILAIATLTCQSCNGASLSGGNSQFLLASWYSTASLIKEGTFKHSKGVMTNGRQFSDYRFTAACNTFPIGTKVKVTRTDIKTSVVVLVTDRTAKRFTGKRIDLSISAMRAIDGIKQGLIQVIVEKI
jgi:rare lipoprotein A